MTETELYRIGMNKGLFPKRINDLVAKRAGYSVNTVLAVLGGNEKVYQSDRAKGKIFAAFIRILYDHNKKINDLLLEFETSKENELSAHQDGGAP